MHDDPEREQQWVQERLDLRQEKLAAELGIPYTRPGANWCVECGAARHTTDQHPNPRRPL